MRTMNIWIYIVSHRDSSEAFFSIALPNVTANVLLSRASAPCLQNHTATKQNMVAIAARIEPLALLPKSSNICSPNMGNTALRIPRMHANGAFADAA